MSGLSRKFVLLFIRKRFTVVGQDHPRAAGNFPQVPGGLRVQRGGSGLRKAPHGVCEVHDMNEIERRFRKAERVLDEMLAVAETTIEERGAAVADWSGRTNHYQNERLSWNYRFETRRPRGAEIEKVSVQVALGEEGPSSITVRRCAEIFQLGKRSRWSNVAKEVIPFGEAARR